MSEIGTQYCGESVWTTERRGRGCSRVGPRPCVLHRGHGGGHSADPMDRLARPFPELEHGAVADRDVKPDNAGPPCAFGGCKRCVRCLPELRADPRRCQRTLFEVEPGECVRPAGHDGSCLARAGGDTSTPIVELVMADLLQRDTIRRSGDALRHAYEKAIDLALYLRQAIAERDGR